MRNHVEMSFLTINDLAESRYDSLWTVPKNLAAYLSATYCLPPRSLSFLILACAINLAVGLRL